MGWFFFAEMFIQICRNWGFPDKCRTREVSEFSKNFQSCPFCALFDFCASVHFCFFVARCRFPIEGLCEFFGCLPFSPFFSMTYYSSLPPARFERIFSRRRLEGVRFIAARIPFSRRREKKKENNLAEKKNTRKRREKRMGTGLVLQFQIFCH